MSDLIASRTQKPPQARDHIPSHGLPVIDLRCHPPEPRALRDICSSPKPTTQNHSTTPYP